MEITVGMIAGIVVGFIFAKYLEQRKRSREAKGKYRGGGGGTGEGPTKDDGKIR